MLVLTAHENEAILIGDNIYLRAYKEGTQIRLAIEAPKTVRIQRIPNDYNRRAQRAEQGKRRLIR